MLCRGKHITQSQFYPSKRQAGRWHPQLALFLSIRKKRCPAFTPLLPWAGQVAGTGGGRRQGWVRPTTAQPQDRQKPSFFVVCFFFFFFGGSNSSSEHSCRVNSENVLCFRLLTKLTCFITFISEQQNRAVHSTLISYQFYFLGLKTYSKFATFHSLDTIY